MQGYPHIYVANASGTNEGNVIVTGDGLPAYVNLSMSGASDQARGPNQPKGTGA
jgi:hypothetical protein